MKSLGIVRKLDGLGRVVIPKEICRTHGWEEGQPMEFFVEDNRLIIQAYGMDYEKQEALKHLDSLLKDADTTEMQGLVKEIINYVSKG